VSHCGKHVNLKIVNNQVASVHTETSNNKIADLRTLLNWFQTLRFFYPSFFLILQPFLT
jgi:hypothetical protein